jgi:hypothetical protein
MLHSPDFLALVRRGKKKEKKKKKGRVLVIFLLIPSRLSWPLKQGLQVLVYAVDIPRKKTCRRNGWISLR